MLGFLAAISLGVLKSCAFWPPEPGEISTEDRIAQFPIEGLDLRGVAEVRWNEFQVPYIVAEDDEDLPYLIGVVHGHLRRAQMELFLKVARGELSSVAGPFANGIDTLLRTLDLDKAVPAIEAGLPDESRSWMSRYAQGVNDQARLFQAAGHDEPYDASALALDFSRVWTVRDTLTIGRLVSVDIGFARTLGVLRRAFEGGVRRPEIDSYLAEVRALDAQGLASFGPGDAVPLQELVNIGRSGSNCFVLSPERSANGAAMLAGDPHLGFLVPNLWCLMGYRSPSDRAVGLTVPGVPVLALGRNERIAWGGTNMAAYSSVLTDVSELRNDDGSYRPAVDPDTGEVLPMWRVPGRRIEPIETRFWFDGEAEVTTTPYGDLLTGAPFLSEMGLPELAFWWRGHEPSDELTAFLRASRARDFEEFRAAWEGYAVAGQNMLYADVDGHIGQVMAFEQVPAAARAARSLVASAGAAEFDPRDGRLGPLELPYSFDPEVGYLVSANNTPIRVDPPVTAGGNSNDRVERMIELIERGGENEDGKLTVKDLEAIQLDVVHRTAHALARAISSVAPQNLEGPAKTLSDRVRDWDGSFDSRSQGALAMQRFLEALFERVYSARDGQEIASAWAGSTGVYAKVLGDLRDGELSSGDLAVAFRAGAEDFDLDLRWGDVHQVTLQYPLGFVPLLGSSWRFVVQGDSGNGGTVKKTAGPLTTDVHSANFGSQSRQICDLSDLDTNWFVLFGGNDGFIGSQNLIDQVSLWNDGQSIQMPLRESVIELQFPRVIRLRN
ncbi:MAG: penicillin acylase family protein [Planctomycetota bacterium]